MWTTRNGCSAHDVGGRIFELTEYLVDVLGVTDVGARHDGKITYHDSCHLLGGLGMSEQPRRLIRNVRGVDFMEMKDPTAAADSGEAFPSSIPEFRPPYWRIDRTCQTHHNSLAQRLFPFPLAKIIEDKVTIFDKIKK